MPNFTAAERELVKSIVCMLSIKKISDSQIVESIYNKTHKRISKKALIYVRRDIKRDSYQYSLMGKGTIPWESNY
jgi:hypothetical protein